MDVRLQDILVMKKPHPCGSKEWLVLRTGMDFRLRCLGCRDCQKSVAFLTKGIAPQKVLGFLRKAVEPFGV